ncbi:MAG: hypothetical protein R2715_10330 [Ilumatobacteraceae bacterium]
MDAPIGEDWRQSLNLIPVVMKAVLGFTPAIKVFGDDYLDSDGTCICDYIHVDDLAAAHLAALTAWPGRAVAATAAFNLGTAPVLVRQVIEMTEEVMGRPTSTCRRAGDPSATYADNNTFVRSTPPGSHATDCGRSSSRHGTGTRPIRNGFEDRGCDLSPLVRSHSISSRHVGEAPVGAGPGAVRRYDGPRIVVDEQRRDPRAAKLGVRRPWQT